MAKPYSGPPPILVGYDASDDAVRALEYASRVAADRKAMLQLVYVADETVAKSGWGLVSDGTDVQNNARRLLAEAAAVARGYGVAKKRIRTKVVLGTPVGVLTQLSNDCSAVVVGSHAGSVGTRRFSGSTAVGLAASVRCPLVVVSDSDGVDPSLPIGVALDADGSSTLALDWVLGNPLFAGVPLKVVSVCKSPQSRVFRSAVSQQQIEAAIAATAAAQSAMVAGVVARYPDAPTIATEVRYGSPVDELCTFGEGVSMLVLQADIRFPTYSVGGVIRGTMAYAQCPVVLVK